MEKSAILFFQCQMTQIFRRCYSDILEHFTVVEMRQKKEGKGIWNPLKQRLYEKLSRKGNRVSLHFRISCGRVRRSPLFEASSQPLLPAPNPALPTTNAFPSNALWDSGERKQ